MMVKLGEIEKKVEDKLGEIDGKMNEVKMYLDIPEVFYGTTNPEVRHESLCLIFEVAAAEEDKDEEESEEEEDSEGGNIRNDGDKRTKKEKKKLDQELILRIGHKRI
ncbi:unnamed protein product [Cochlearia groenlandica]